MPNIYFTYIIPTALIVNSFLRPIIIPPLFELESLRRGLHKEMHFVHVQLENVQKISNKIKLQNAKGKRPLLQSHEDPALVFEAKVPKLRFAKILWTLTNT